MRSARTSAMLRQDNSARALGLVHAFGEASRAQLASWLGVTRTTAKAVAEGLVAAGLVVEEERAEALGRGRPSPVVRPAPGGPVVMAVELAVSHVTVAVVGLGTHLVTVQRERLPSSPAPDTVIGLIGDLAGSAARASGPLAGVGVSFYGAVRPDGFVLHAPSLRWRELPLADLISRAVGGGVPVRVGNDADLAAMAEARRAGDARPRDLLYLIAERGLGAGLVNNGVLVGGATGSFGEVGHMVVNPDGVRCPCGRIGCWETEVDARSLLRRAGRRARGDLQHAVAGVLADAGTGDDRARVALAEYTRWLGLGLVNMVNIFDPPRVVVGGVLARVLPAIAGELSTVVAQQGLVRRESPLPITAARLGEHSALIGAADLAFADLLAAPLGTVRASAR
ncbi:ROK family protein [Allokutzneria sp. A3M-2-11 16]|uniref:ROK family protein n=1 Tax=Allokutzneria sp. A3M-2-11 16 TaxID=2962043 RepID=UPI0020B7ABE5|nr:ROK family protein [Allokutzneria sp. A3M-2-11 16]MCP3803234.1 ROK family protein [Allokutzneria sp. A3M-2-11 16]